jgi:hypothetical protein
MVIVELCCDHPDCTKERRVIKKAPDIVGAKRMIDAGEVCCPIHGTRTDPLVFGRPEAGPLPFG